MPYHDPDPRKDYARQKLIKAVHNGKIKRPEQCENCLTPCTPDGHHNNYSKPLKVSWLCKSCHLLTHFRLNGFYKKFDREELKKVSQKEATVKKLDRPHYGLPPGYKSIIPKSLVAD